MDYSILLPRSSDYVAEQPLSAYDPTKFDPSDPQGQIGYSSLLDNAYPDQSQRMLVLDLIQNLRRQRPNIVGECGVCREFQNRHREDAA